MAATIQAKNPRVVLDRDHERIGVLLTNLVAVVRGDDREAATKAWRRAEGAVLRHFDVEEMFVFPTLAATHKSEVDALRREHDDMRRKLGEIGIAFELHTIRAAAIEELCARLGEHATRERDLAYVEAERALDAATTHTLFQRLKKFATSLGETLSATGAHP